VNSNLVNSIIERHYTAGVVADTPFTGNYVTHEFPVNRVLAFSSTV
jgi:hypothetical protein